MITRIVKMTFQDTKVDDFKEFTQSIRHKIRNFPGCEHLEIFQDIHNKAIFFTYSRWKSEQDLANYRDSEFFRETWSTARGWFAAAAEAWSVIPS